MKRRCCSCQTEAAGNCERCLCTPCCRKHAAGVCPNHRPEGSSKRGIRGGASRQQNEAFAGEPRDTHIYEIGVLAKLIAVIVTVGLHPVPPVEFGSWVWKGLVSRLFVVKKSCVWGAFFAPAAPIFARKNGHTFVARIWPQKCAHFSGPRRDLRPNWRCLLRVCARNLAPLCGAIFFEKNEVRV
jgi:hypothetical protein